MISITQNDISQMLRIGIEKKLEEYSDEELVHIDKDILEVVLFDKIYLSRGIMKVPVWSGNFLSKIDLSEISFRNVAWSFFSKGALYARYKDEDSFSSYFTRVFEEGKQVIYRNTNAKIDFSNSFEALHSKGGRAIVENCDFSGTDLSNNELSVFSYAKSCQFDYTNIDFAGSFRSYYAGNTSFCSFKGNVLCGMRVNLLSFLLLMEANEENNFSETGLSLYFSFEELKSLQSETLNNYAAKFLSCLKKGHLKGCYLNGELLPEEEKEQDKLVSTLFNNVPKLPKESDGPKLIMENLSNQ